MILGTLRAVLGAIYSRYQSTGSTTDAYLDDFLIVDAESRFVSVETEGRWIAVAAEDRELLA